MKKSLILACLLGFAVPALAGGNSNNSDTINNYGNTTTNNQGGSGGQGGAGGQGVGIGIAGAAAGASSSATGGNATGGAATATGGAVVGSGNSSNHNTNLNNANASVKNNNLNAQGQLQGQQQGQDQGQSQSTKNSNNAAQSTNVTVEGDTYKQERPVVNTAYAPTVFPTAPCMGSSSIGATGSLLSISGGTTWTSSECMILETARGFDQAGYKVDGLHIRCQAKYAATAPSCKAIKDAETTGEEPKIDSAAAVDATDAYVKSNFLGVSF